MKKGCPKNQDSLFCEDKRSNLIIENSGTDLLVYYDLVY